MFWIELWKSGFVWVKPGTTRSLFNVFSKHRQSTWVLGTVVSTWKTQILIFTIAPLEQVLLLSPFWRENGVIKRLSNLLKIIEIGKARIRNLYSESLDPKPKLLPTNLCYPCAISPSIPCHQRQLLESHGFCDTSLTHPEPRWAFLPQNFHSIYLFLQTSTEDSCFVK